MIQNPVENRWLKDTAWWLILYCSHIPLFHILSFIQKQCKGCYCFLVLPSSSLYLVLLFYFILHSITRLGLTVRSVQKVTTVLTVFQWALQMVVYVSPSPKSSGGLRGLGYNQGMGCVFWGGRNGRVGKRCWRAATNEFLCCFKPFKLYSFQLMYHRNIFKTAER